MKKDKKLTLTRAKTLYNAYLKGGGIPLKKVNETPRYANDNQNQGRSPERMETTYKILEWTFILALIALVSFVIYYRFQL
tara:strand:+ start:63 stop:302 length:240 start_codon:yes stop_codon:yes gene_type:complete